MAQAQNVAEDIEVKVATNGMLMSWCIVLWKREFG
jgi:hypothetical protein